GAMAAARAGNVDVREVVRDDTPFRLYTKPISTANGTYIVQVVQDATGEHRILGVLLAGVAPAVTMGVFLAAAYVLYTVTV
ncbi:hypothetical protein ACQ7B2_14395, partial [Escherichia coli]